MTLRSYQTSQMLEFHKPGEEGEWVSEQTAGATEARCCQNVAQIAVIQPIAFS